MKRNRSKNIWAGIILATAFIVVTSTTGFYIKDKAPQLADITSGNEQPATGSMTFADGLLEELREYSGAGADETTWLEVYAMPHDATPSGGAYDENNSATMEASAYAYADTDGWSDDLISQTSFDIVVRARFNATHAKNATMFKDTRCLVNISVSGDWAVGGDISDTGGARLVTANVSTQKFIWINFYWNNSGTGYQIDDDGTLTMSSVKVRAKY